MSLANNTLRITELDPASIKENLKAFLRDQDEFTDFDFEGSGIGVLLDILAYNAHYHGFYVNMVGNEMYLDTAKMRSSVISRAKELGYVPSSMHGSSVRVDITVTPSDAEDQELEVLTLDRYTKFLARDKDGINYQFIAVDSNTVTKSANTFVFEDILLKQGETVTRQYLMESNNENRRFTIPSANVDTTTLRVSVQQSVSNTNIEEYTLAEDITEIDSDSSVYWLEENENGEYSIQFGDNYIGKKPNTGSVIIATYFETEGVNGDNIDVFYLSDAVGGEFNDNVIITAANSSSGGSEKESIEETRFRAPYYYTTQNRAVTIKDYETLILRDYNNIDSVAVWGGEDNDPVIYGKVFASFKTRGNYFLTNLEKQRIIDELIANRNVVTVTPEIVDPEYVYLLVKGTINYNPSLTSRTADQIITLVRAAIEDYNDQELNRFDSTFRKSKLQSYIENADRSILGSDITVYVQKRVLMESGTNKIYEVSYDLPLKKGDFNNSLYTTPYIKVFDYNAVERNIYFEEKPFSDTGIDSISILNAGKNYTSAPTVTITGDGTGAEATAYVTGGKIYRIDIDNPGTNYTRATITLSGGGGSEARVSPKLQAKFGTIRSFYYSGDGERVILSENVGTIDYENGTFDMNTFASRGTDGQGYYGEDEISFNFPIERGIVLPLRNRIISIDPDDPIAIQINAVVES